MPAERQNATLSSSSIRKTQTARKTASAPYFPSLDRPSLSFGEFAHYASDINNKDSIMFNIDPYSDLAGIVDTIFHYISCSQGYDYMADLDWESARNLFEEAIEKDLKMYVKKPTDKLHNKNKLNKFAHVTVDKPLRERSTRLQKPFEYGTSGFGTQLSPIIINDEPDAPGSRSNPILICDISPLPSSYSFNFLNLRPWRRHQFRAGFDGNLQVLRIINSENWS